MAQAQFLDIAAIVLAGGRSARMGSPKALLAWPPSGTPFVVQLTRQLTAAGLTRVAVVTGAHHLEIQAVLAQEGVSVHFNPDHAAGQLTSLQVGLRWAFGPGTPPVPASPWALVTLVDLPALRPETVLTLLHAARDAGESIRAVRPAFDGRHGHPVLWHRQMLSALLAADPMTGAKPVIRALEAEGRVLTVSVSDPGVVDDVDTPEDYRRLTGG